MKYVILNNIVALAATALLISCSGSSNGEEPGEPVTQAIRFAPGKGSSLQSRVPTMEPLQDSYSTFGVKGWKTVGASDEQIVFSHADGTPYCVMWNEPLTAWHYDMTTPDGYEQFWKYWDLSASSYRFVGVAPYSDASIIDPVTGVIRIDDVIGNIYPANGYDWAVAHEVVTLTPGVDPEPVSLEFHRLMSGIEVRVFLAKAGDIDVSDLKVNMEGSAQVVTRADYNDGTWTSSASTQLVCNLTGLSARVTGVDRATSTPILRFIEIPQDLVGDDITFTVTLSNGRQVSGTFTLAEGWEAEKVYVYYLKLNIQDNYIFMDVDVETFDWTQGDDIDINDPVVNW